jgi:hypothetical protein
MSQPRMFGEADLTKVLSDGGNKLARKMSAYLIGGCAMTFMGRKVATKDIDVVLGSPDDAKEFTNALGQIGFVSVKTLTEPYATMGTFAIMEDSRGMRFDIYDRQVCRALELSAGMKSRTRPYRTFGNLQVHLIAPEDIFLFKGITEREADLDDMRILAEIGLDWKAIEAECLSQKRSGRWAYLLGTKLMELRMKFDIASPIIKTLMDHADMDLLVYAFGRVIGNQETPFKEIARVINEKYGYKDSWTRKQLALLEARGFVRKRRRGREDFYSMTTIRLSRSTHIASRFD